MLMLVLSAVVLVAVSVCAYASEECTKKSEKPACACGCGTKSSCGTKCGTCGTKKKAKKKVEETEKLEEAAE